MSNFICQNEVNMVDEPLEVEKPVLECSSEMDELRCITDTALSPVTKIIVMGTNFPVQICTDSQRTEPWDIHD